MARTLVIRLSALGDVAMLIPVLYSVAKSYPGDEFVLITKNPLLPLFDYKPNNVRVIPVFTKGNHAGIKGLWKLIGELASQQIDQVADLHNLLRSKQIRFFFQLKGKKLAVIDKGKKEKKELTRRNHKVLAPLKTNIQRYMDTFHLLGYNFQLQFQSIFEFGKQSMDSFVSLTGEKKGIWIGIAPFAKHIGKILPLDKTAEIIRVLSNRPDCRIFLFGGKEDELQFKKWEEEYTSVVSIAGRLKFTEELQLMSFLDLMVSMDSGNMHLASLVGIPVVSIWGATHPYAGFQAYGQSNDNAVQIDLFCRPCSVFGNKACYRKDYACLHSITPEMVLRKIDSIISKSKEKDS